MICFILFIDMTDMLEIIFLSLSSQFLSDSTLKYIELFLCTDFAGRLREYFSDISLKFTSLLFK